MNNDDLKIVDVKNDEEEKDEILENDNTNTLESSILSETDPDELNKIIELFNINLKKKNIVRSGKLNEVQDKIVDEMYDRVNNNPDDFSNMELLQYHKIVQETINKTDSTLDNIQPSIQINQQFNVDDKENSFDSESRKRIIDAVNSILTDAEQNEEKED